MMNTANNVFVKTERHNYRLADVETVTVHPHLSLFLSHTHKQAHNLAT